MPRKLKTYTTSAGFFDLAVAAPSMKAALEAWGSNSNLFNQGFAKVSQDPDVVKATMAKPGRVLRRPVGTNSPFSERSELPSGFLSAGAIHAPRRARSSSKPVESSIDEKAARKAAKAFEREKQRQARQTQREEEAQEKERRRRDEAIAEAEGALNEAKAAHQKTIDDLNNAQAELERRAEAENTRWKKEQERLEAALRKARTLHLRLL